MIIKHVRSRGISDAEFARERIMRPNYKRPIEESMKDWKKRKAERAALINWFKVPGNRESFHNRVKDIFANKGGK